MNRIHTAITAAILASSMAGGVALAGDKAHKEAADSQSAPVTQQQQPGAGPQVQDMDTNAQRQHDPSGTTAADPGANTDGSMGAATPSVKDLDTNAQRAHEPQAGAVTGGSAGVESTGSSGEARSGADASTSGSDASASASGETRDWSQIDGNNDNLISPDEMEGALGAAGPQAGEGQQQSQEQPQAQQPQQQQPQQQ